MTHDRKHYTIQDEWINKLEISASFWTEPDEPRPISIVTIDTGMAHLQISATETDLRNLARFFAERADALQALDAAHAVNLEDAAAKSGFGLVP